MIKNIEEMVKSDFIVCLFGMLFGGLIMSFVLMFGLGNNIEIMIYIANGVILCVGLSMVFIIHLVYYLKTYAVISRKNLKQLKEKI